MPFLSGDKSPIPTLDYFERAKCPIAGSDAVGAGNVRLGLAMMVTIQVGNVGDGDIDFVVTDAFELVRAECVKRNGASAGGSNRVQKGATPITEVLDAAVDNAVDVAAVLDDAGSTFAAGDTLRIVHVKGAGTGNADINLWVRPIL
jgi:hypothetical protein